MIASEGPQSISCGGSIAATGIPANLVVAERYNAEVAKIHGIMTDWEFEVLGDQLAGDVGSLAEPPRRRRINTWSRATRRAPSVGRDGSGTLRNRSQLRGRPRAAGRRILGHRPIRGVGRQVGLQPASGGSVPRSAARPLDPLEAYGQLLGATACSSALADQPLVRELAGHGVDRSKSCGRVSGGL